MTKLQYYTLLGTIWLSIAHQMYNPWIAGFTFLWAVFLMIVGLLSELNHQ